MPLKSQRTRAQIKLLGISSAIPKSGDAHNRLHQSLIGGQRRAEFWAQPCVVKSRRYHLATCAEPSLAGSCPRCLHPMDNYSFVSSELGWSSEPDWWAAMQIHSPANPQCARPPTNPASVLLSQALAQQLVVALNATVEQITLPAQGSVDAQAQGSVDAPAETEPDWWAAVRQPSCAARADCKSMRPRKEIGSLPIFAVTSLRSFQVNDIQGFSARVCFPLSCVFMCRGDETRHSIVHNM